MKKPGCLCNFILFVLPGLLPLPASALDLDLSTILETKAAVAIPTAEKKEDDRRWELLQSEASAEFKLFKGWKYAGIGTAISVFDYLSGNGTANIGARLRGILDKQDFILANDIRGKNNALDTTAALVLNMDFPIHILTTHFSEMGKSKLLSYLDVELQLSPFFDMGLLANRATGNTFNLKEGLYAGGIEVLVFPQQWKSYTIRASLGIDIGRTVLDGFLDNDWRSPRKNYEIFIGVGNHF